jgi:hypothetical protein
VILEIYTIKLRNESLILVLDSCFSDKFANSVHLTDESCVDCTPSRDLTSNRHEFLWQDERVPQEIESIVAAAHEKGFLISQEGASNSQQNSSALSLESLPSHLRDRGVVAQMIIFASSSRREKSFSFNNGSGIFTSALVKVLKDGKNSRPKPMTIGEFLRNVAVETTRLEPRQHPQFRVLGVDSKQIEEEPLFN